MNGRADGRSTRSLVDATGLLLIAIVLTAVTAPPSAGECCPQYITDLALPFEYGTPSTMGQTIHKHGSELADSLAIEFGTAVEVVQGNARQLPDSIYFGNLPVASSHFSSDQALIAHTKSIVSKSNALFAGIAGADLGSGEVHDAGSRKVVVLEQSHEGVSVRGALVHFLYDEVNEVLLRISSSLVDVGTLSTSPLIDEPTAVALAETGLGFPAPGDTTTACELEIVPVLNGSSEIEPLLAWSVSSAADSIGTWLSIVNANDGSIVSRELRGAFAGTITGRLRGWTYPGSARGDDPSLQPLGNVILRVGSSEARSSPVTGEFQLSHTESDSLVVLESELTSRLIQRLEYGNGGSVPDFMRQVGANEGGILVDFQPNAASQDGYASIAATACVYWLEETFDRIVAIEPEFDGLSGDGWYGRRLRVLVNRPAATVNAFFEEPATLKFDISPLAQNPLLGLGDAGADRSIISHEFGHAITYQVRAVAPTNRCVDEALADAIAAMSWNDPGHAYVSEPPIELPLRSSQQLGNPIQFDGADNNCVGINPDPYPESRALSGFYWTLKLGLEGNGVADASDVVLRLLILSIRSGGNVTRQEQVYETILADDDDGNLFNGTPNYAAIEEAATIHGFDVLDLASAPVLFANQSGATAPGQSVSAALLNKETVAAVAVRYNDDLHEDLVVSLRGAETLQGFKGDDALGSELGEFSQDNTAFLTVQPKNARGISAADYDGDGDVDLFIGAMATSGFNPDARPYLLRNPGGTSPTFSNDATTLLPSGTGVAQVWSGAWGDYNGDGWLDLHLVRAEDHDGSPQGIDGQGLDDVLLEAIVSPSTRRLNLFKDRTYETGLPSTATETSASTWADVDEDGDLDLYVCWLGAVESASTPGWSELYINNGNETFTPVAGNQTGPRFPRLGYVASVDFADISGDGHVDIALGRRAPSTSGPPLNTLVRYNTAEDLGNLTFEPQLNGDPDFKGQIQVNDIAIDDINSDGLVDVVGVPAVDGWPPTVLVGTGSGSNVVHGDIGRGLGLPKEAVNGFVHRDLNGDGDVDLFLGTGYETGDTAALLFTSDTATRSGQNTLRVIVSAPQGYASPDGVGAAVQIEYQLSGDATPRFQRRHLSAASDRGTQLGQSVVFGVGDAPTADVTVIWPDGTIASSSNVTLSAAAKVSIDYPVTGAATFADTDITGTRVVDPSTGKARWTFTWTSTHPMIFGEVIVTDGTAGGPCDIDQGSEIALRGGRADVRMTSRYASAQGKYVHTLEWRDVQCAAPCNYYYKVRAWSEDTPGNQTLHESGTKVLKSLICVSGA